MNFKNIFFVIAFFLIPDIAIAKKTLTVYATSSFGRDWLDDNHTVKRKFEERCDCIVNLITIESGNSIISRLKFEGKNSKADIALGFDVNHLKQAKESGLFTEIKYDNSLIKIPIPWDNNLFIPYDYSYFAFVYNSNKLLNPPKSFKELIERDDIKIIIPDPRSSSVGTGILTWVATLYPNEVDQKIVWKKLFKKIITVTKGWGESYSLFMKGEGTMVSSYITSPAYHMIVDKNYDYKAAAFSDGHFIQVELAGKLKTSKEPELADKFIKFILTQDFQRFIAKSNFMLPVIDLGYNMPEEYKYLITPSKTLYLDGDFVGNNNKRWIKIWLESSSD